MKKCNCRAASLLVVLCLLLSIVQPGICVSAAGTVNYDVNSAAGWSGSGYTVDEAGNFNFEGWGQRYNYVLDTYDFTGDFVFIANHLNVFTGNADILFCYQDSSNYYKLSLGMSSTLSKVIGGTQTVLASDAAVLAGQDISVKITHLSGGNILVTTAGTGASGNGKTLFNVTDNSLGHGKIGLSYENSFGSIGGMNLSGNVSGGSDVPGPGTEITTKEVDERLNVASDWSGTGYSMTEPSWGKIEFANWGESSGQYIFDKYEFINDFSYLSNALNVYNGSANMLFCYQNDNNYYKLSIGADTKLSKVIEGKETVLASSDEQLTSTEMSVKIAHSSNGNIIVTYGAKEGGGAGTLLFSVNDADLKSGKIGLSGKGTGGYFGSIFVKGSVITEAEPTPPPIVVTTKEVDERLNVASDWSGTGYSMTESSWGKIDFANWGESSGQYINEKYDYINDFSYTSRQLNVYNGSANMLFCYQNDNNYYKLSIGTDTKLSKVVEGKETVLASSDEQLTGKEISVKIAHSASGNIIVTRGTKDGDGTGTLMFSVTDTDLKYGKVGLSGKGTGGYFANLYAKGSVITEAEPTTPPVVIVTKEIDERLNIASDWSGIGYSMTEPSWGKIEFSNWGEQSGQYIYDKYEFINDFSYISNALNVYGGSANMLFCYQNDNNYYKLSIGVKTELSKVVNGTETVLASSDDDLKSTEMSVKIAHSSNGDIIVTRGAKEGYGNGTLMFSVNDTDLKSGKIGLNGKGTGGYFGSIFAKGSVIDDEPTVNPSPSPSVSPSPTPSVTPSATPEVTPIPQLPNVEPIEPVLKQGTVYDEKFESISADEKAKWVNCGTNGAELAISDGHIGGADWKMSAVSVMLYTGKRFDNESYTVGVDVQHNYGAQPGNSGSVLFNYTANAGANGLAQSGYAVEIQGGTSGNVLLKKYAQDVWNKVETIATYSHIDSLKDKDVRVEITYTSGGTISVDLIADGDRFTAFDGIKDTTYTSGYIGVMKTSSGFIFDNVKIDALTESDVKIVSAALNTRYLGRTVTQNGTAKMYYPYCGIEFTVENTRQVQIEARKAYSANNSNPYIGVFVDDSQEYSVYKCSDTNFGYIAVTLFDDNKPHKVKIVKLNGIDTSIEIRNIKLCEAAANASSIKATGKKARNIEFIGDSVTVGYGLMDNATVTENANLSYAGRTAAFFDADVSMAAISGAGFVATETQYGSLRPNTFYPYIFAWDSLAERNKWDFGGFTPDIIVVNIGENGGGANTVKNYVDFVSQVRTLNNDANKQIPIILCQGPMSNSAYANIEAAVNQINNNGDTNVYALSIGTNMRGGVDSHPTAAEHEAAAVILENKIMEILPGWAKKQGNGMQAKIILPAEASVISGSTVRASSVITSAYDKVSGYVAEYGANGLANIVPVTLLADGDNTIVTADIKMSNTANTLKMFIWVDTGMIPACESQSFSVK